MIGTVHFSHRDWWIPLMNRKTSPFFAKKVDTLSNVFLIKQQYRKKGKPLELLAKRTKYFEASLARLHKKTCQCNEERQLNNIVFSDAISSEPRNTLLFCRANRLWLFEAVSLSRVFAGTTSKYHDVSISGSHPSPYHQPYFKT